MSLSGPHEGCVPQCLSHRWSARFVWLGRAAPCFLRLFCPSSIHSNCFGAATAVLDVNCNSLCNWDSRLLLVASLSHRDPFWLAGQDGFWVKKRCHDKLLKCLVRVVRTADRVAAFLVCDTVCFLVRAEGWVANPSAEGAAWGINSWRIHIWLQPPPKQMLFK